MNYPLQAKPKKNLPLRRVWKILLILLILVFLLGSIFPNLFGSASFVIAKPIWKIRDIIVYNIFQNDYFRSKSYLISERRNLETQNQELISKLTEFEILRADNEAFRTILGRVSERKGIALPVIAHPTQTPYDVMVLDINDSQSVSIGDEVVIGNISLGKVVETGDGFAKVNMHSSPNTVTVGTLVSSGTTLELQGKGGGNFSVKVPRDTVITVDELVVLPGDPSLAIARVSDIEESEKDSFKLIRLISPVNIFSLKWVEVLK